MVDAARHRAAHLDVIGELELMHGDHRLICTGVGDRLVVTAEQPEAIVSFVTAFVPHRRQRLRLITSGLTRAGLTIELRCRQRRLVQLGAEARSWWLRLFGLPHVSCHSWRLVWSLLT